MGRKRAPANKPPVKKKESVKNAKPPVEVISNPSGWKKFWVAVNFDWKALVATIALLFSIITFFQNNNRQIKQDIKEEEQIVQTRNDKNLEKLKIIARGWFNQGDFIEAADYYEQVFEKYPDDIEGYQKFLGKGKDLKATNTDWCRKPDIIFFFEQAKKLTKDTTDVVKILDQCKQL